MYMPRSNVSELWTWVAAGTAVVLLGLWFWAVVWPHIAEAIRRSKAKGKVQTGLFLLMAAGAVMYGGAKSGAGRVSFPRTNPEYELIKDAGSSVSNDYVTVAYERHAIVPDDAVLMVCRRTVGKTNTEDWVEHVNTTVGAFPSPQVINYPEAVSNDWAVFTTWQPKPSVETNGVLHVLWRGVRSAPGRLDAVPLGTEVRSERGFVFAPPRNPNDEGKSVLEVTIPEGGGDFGFYLVQAPAGTLIEWGDGTTTPYTEKTHHYAEGGVYRVKIGKEATRFSCDRCTGWNYITGFLAWGDNITNADGCFKNMGFLAGELPPWGPKITTAQRCFYGCFSLTGSVPEWGASLTNARECFQHCERLGGCPPPNWGNVQNAQSTFQGCTGLVGPLPAWGNVVTARSTYQGCTGIVSAVPAWGAKVADASACYVGCTGLTGNIPEWGEKLTNAQYCFNGCTGLTGAAATDAETLMPSRVTKNAGCVDGASDAVRALFSRKWGGTQGDAPVYTARDYVQDGLVCMWDAIENAGWGVHTNEGNVWKDLVGGVDATFVDNSTWTRTSWDENKLVIALTSYLNRNDIVLSEALADAVNSSYFTTEQTYWASSSSHKMGGMGAIHRSARFYAPLGAFTDSTVSAFYNHFYMTANASVTSGNNANIGGFPNNWNAETLNSLTMVYDKTQNKAFSYRSGALDQQKTAYAIEPRWTAGANSTLCPPHMYANCLTHYYCIRIYNRPLTAEEVAHNYAVDKERYGLD